MGELTRVIKPRTDEECAWGGAPTTLRVMNHPHAPSNRMSPDRGSSMATKSTSPSRVGMQEVRGDMMGELTRVLKQRGAAEATDTVHMAEGTAQAAAMAKAKAEAAAKARCQLAHIFAVEAAAGALQQGEEEVSPTQTIKGDPQTKSFQSLPPPAARRALDLSTTVGEVQGGRQLGGNSRPAFLTELRQVLQQGSHGAGSEEGGGTTYTPAKATAKAEGREPRHTLQRSPPGPMAAPAGGMQDMMGELTRVLKQRGATEATAATAATVTRRPSFGRKKRPAQGEAAAGAVPVAPDKSSNPELPPPAMAATAATASVVTRRLSFGRKTKTKEKQPSEQAETAVPGAVPMAPDESSTAEPPPPAMAATAAATAAVVTRRPSFGRKKRPAQGEAAAGAVPVAPDEPSNLKPLPPAPAMAATAATAATATTLTRRPSFGRKTKTKAKTTNAVDAACATVTFTVAGVAVGAAKVAAASGKVHKIDGYLDHCQARHAEASGVVRLAMIEEDTEPGETEAVPVEPDESSATEPPPPRQESFSRVAARAAAAARKAAVAATAATAATAARRPSFERKRRPAPLVTKLTVEARRLTVELEGCLEKGLGLGLDASNRITEIKPAGQAAASRELLLGDVVVSVDGAALEGRQLQHVMRPGVALTLEVERVGGGFRRTRQLSFERKTAKTKREEAAARKEAAEAEAEKVAEVMLKKVSGGSDGGSDGDASGGTPCATFAVAAAAAADLFATIAAAAELSAAAAARDDADEASANVPLHVPLRAPLSALLRARQHAAQHTKPAASAAATLAARRPSFLETRPGTPPAKRSPWVAATAVTASAVARRPSFGRKKRLAGPDGTQVVVTLEAPTNEADGVDADLAV